MIKITSLYVRSDIMKIVSLSPRNIKETSNVIKNISIDDIEYLEKVGKQLEFDDVFLNDKFKLRLGKTDFIEIPKVFREIFIPVSSGCKEVDVISNSIFNTDLSNFDPNKIHLSYDGFSYLVTYLYLFVAYCVPYLKNADNDPSFVGVGEYTKVNILSTEHVTIAPLAMASSPEIINFTELFLYGAAGLNFTKSDLYLEELCSNYMDKL